MRKLFEEAKISSLTLAGIVLVVYGVSALAISIHTSSSPVKHKFGTRTIEEIISTPMTVPNIEQPWDNDFKSSIIEEIK
jgi:ABC-type spermidine/putrescine transport system permease subunit II